MRLEIISIHVHREIEPLTKRANKHPTIPPAPQTPRSSTNAPGHSPSTSTTPPTMPPRSKPLIVVLGLGEMGRTHAENLSKQRAIRLGLASTRESVLHTEAARLHADAVYATYQSALDDPAVAAVVIATSVATHPEMVTLCARAGKHIFCEKPLGHSVATIAPAVEAVAAAGIRFMVGFQRRWDASFSHAYATIRRGDVGTPVVLKCTSGDPEFPEKYHRFAEKNSMLLDLAVHDIDQARWLTASEVASVYAKVDALTYPGLRKMGDADVGVAVLSMTNGATVMVHLSRALAYGYNVTAEFVGTKGSLQIGDVRRDDVVLLQERRKGRVVQWDFRERFQQAFESEMEAYVRLVCAGEEEVGKLLEDARYAGAEDALRTTVVAEALVRSAESGTPEKVVYE